MGERSAGGKVKRADESNRWVSKRDDIGPGYVQVGRWMVIGPEEDLLAEGDGTFGGGSGVMVPFLPPVSTGVTGGIVIRVAAVKVDGKGTTGTAISGGMVGKAAIQIDGN